LIFPLCPAVTQLRLNRSRLFSGHGTATAPARSVGTLAGIVQREANVLAYIDGFWLTFGFAIAGLIVTALITKSPPGPFTPVTKGR